MEPITFLLLFLAGMLITLSPCILPVLPLVVSSGLQQDKYAPIKTGLGLATGFAILGVIFSALAASFDIPLSAGKYIFGTILLLAGIALTLPSAGAKSSALLEPLSNFMSKLSQKFENKRGGSFMLGFALGGIWSPCAGPLLAAAFALTATTATILASGIQMFIFGLGAAVPLIAVAYLLRGGARKMLPNIAGKAEKIRFIMGILLIIVAVIVLTGLDAQLVGVATQYLPETWLNLITTL